MGNTEAMQAYLNGYKSPIKDFHFGVETEPVKSTATMIANDPAMNLLLTAEATVHYEALIEPKMHYLDITGNDCVNEDDVREVIGKYTALPIDCETRILKIQHMLNVMKKKDTGLDFEPYPNQLVNGIEVNLI